MEPQRYAIIDDDDIVLNIILWDGETIFNPDAGKVVGPVTTEVEIGDSVDADGSLVKKAQPREITLIEDE